MYSVRCAPPPPLQSCNTGAHSKQQMVPIWVKSLLVKHHQHHPMKGSVWQEKSSEGSVCTSHRCVPLLPSGE